MSSNDGNLSTLDSSLDLALILSSLESAGREELHDELLSLSAIYDSDQTSALSIYHHTSGGGGSDSKTHRSKDSITRRAISYDATVTDTLRLTLSTTLPLDSAPDNHHPFHHGHSHDEDPKVDDKGSAARVDLLLSIPPAYPTCQPPLIQLQSMYLSSFAVTDELFGEIVRLYMHERPNAMTDTGGGGGVEWTEGQVCLYEGIECARHKCAQWVRERRRAVAALEQERTTGRIPSGTGVDSGPVRDGVYGIPWGKLDEQHVVLESLDGKTNDGSQSTGRQAPANQCPKILSTEGLLDRKSVSREPMAPMVKQAVAVSDTRALDQLFVGHVAEVHSVEEVSWTAPALMSAARADIPSPTPRFNWSCRLCCPIQRLPKRLTTSRLTDSCHPTESNIRTMTTMENQQRAVDWRICYNFWTSTMYSSWSVDGTAVFISVQIGSRISTKCVPGSWGTLSQFGQVCELTRSCTGR